MKNILFILTIIIAGYATQNDIKSDLQSQPTKTELHLYNGLKLLSNRNIKEAIAEFEEAIVLCKEQYANDERRIYTDRGVAETIYYVSKASIDGQSAIVVAPTCSDALYLKGFASLEIGQIDAAEEYVKQAIDMAPFNSRYLSELGHIYHVKRDWKQALDIFTRSEKAANASSPDKVKEKELSRAKRGIGYSLIELEKLEEAKEKFKECLEINSNDERALKELKYIEHLRKPFSLLNTK